jgi:hypothetical protein
MIAIESKTIWSVLNELKEEFALKYRLTYSKEWQGIKQEKRFASIDNVVLCCREMPQNLLDMNQLINPNQPWSDIHFAERISGKPLNPGESYKIWPFYGQDKKVRNHSEKFSHTYMERFWPKYADIDLMNKGGIPAVPFEKFSHKMSGIRYNYGDLNDVVNLLKRDPGTRQAYLPIFFPEDTGSVEGQRVPCTLGYHFMFVDDKLYLNYHIRSCDYYRHLRDDIYLAMRLALWVKNQINPEIKLGEFCMFISNLHIFESEISRLQRENE